MSRRALRLSLALSLLACAPPSRAATIQERPALVSTSWGIAFSPFHVRYMAGGGEFAWNVPAYGTLFTGTGATDLRDIAVSPDGDAWIAEPTQNKIWHYSLVDDVFAPIPVSGGPWGIAWGADGNIWFTEHSGNKVARMTRSFSVTEFPIATSNSHPGAMALGLDGNVWFVEENGNNLASVTPDGTITEYPLPSVGAFPLGVAASASGQGLLAVVEAGPGKIAFFDTHDKTFFKEVDIPSPLSAPRGIAAGPDGAFWFVETATSKVGRATLLGVTELFVPTGSSHPRAIALGPDGALWFSEQGTGNAGRVAFHRPGDVNGDGTVDVADVFSLVNFLFAGGPAPK